MRVRDFRFRFPDEEAMGRFVAAMAKLYARFSGKVILLGASLSDDGRIVARVRLFRPPLRAACPDLAEPVLCREFRPCPAEPA
ncbi:MAG: hypothetical protein WC985_09355 [Thermoplasmata archaeon]